MSYSYVEKFQMIEEELVDAIEDGVFGGPGADRANWDKIKSLRLESFWLTKSAMQFGDPLDVVKVFSMKVPYWTDGPVGFRDSLWLSRVCQAIFSELRNEVHLDHIEDMVKESLNKAYGFIPETIQEAWDAFGIPHDEDCSCESCEEQDCCLIAEAKLQDEQDALWLSWG